MNLSLSAINNWLHGKLKQEILCLQHEKERAKILKQSIEKICKIEKRIKQLQKRLNKGRWI